MNKSLSTPLVSIGVPTYNRVEKLKRALESALNQEYQNIEIVISDNASTDYTEAYCRNLVLSDNRIKYFRHQKNQGVTKNFIEVLYRSTGQFFMWLADDDWLCAGYINAAVKILINRPDVSIAYAKGRFYDDSNMVVDIENSKSIIDEDSVARIISYYADVTYNCMFYGLMRRRELLKIYFRDHIGADWLIVASMLLQGKSIVMENDFFINRHAGGTSKNIIYFAKKSNSSIFSYINNLKFIYFFISFKIFIDISINCWLYKRMNIFRRIALAICCSFIIFIRYSYLSIHENR